MNTQALEGLRDAALMHGRTAEALDAMSRLAEAAVDRPSAYAGIGDWLRSLGRASEAATWYRKSIAQEPNRADLQNNLAASLMDMRQYADACALLDHAILLDPQLTVLHSNRATCLHVLRRLPEALDAYRAAAASAPRFIYPRVQALSVARELCDWRFWDQDLETLRVLRPSPANTAPQLDLLFLPLTAEQLRSHAECYAAAANSRPATYRNAASRPTPDLTRVGYVTDELRDHVVGSLLVEIMELHDKTNFVVHLFDWGRASKSVVERRVRRSGISIHDISSLNDAQAAQYIASLGIDILVDLKGYTTDHRIDIFRHRPTPVQMTWLGYPGTTGDRCFDYLLADSFVVPEGEEGNYTEKILRLPHVFMPSDRRRPVANAAGRIAHGIPEDAVVYCYLGRSAKITPEVFSDWLAIVSAVPDAVLWLRADDDFVRTQLEREAREKGFDAGRLIFAKHQRMRFSDLVARYTIADVALDTFPYGSHATASEALWAGCPILTRVGATFASRVAGSLLNTMGLPELVTESREQFRRTAIELGQDRERLATLRQHVQAAKRDTPVFDSPAFAHALERAFSAVLGRYREGLPPDSIWVV